MSLRPWYNQDANFQTNAKSFMDYLARTNKFLEVLIEDYENFQELVIEELERIKFDSEIAVDDILVNWLEDGTLARIINDGVLGNKADTDWVDNLINQLRDDIQSDIERLEQKDEDINTHKADKTFVDSEIERLDQTDENLTTQLEHIDSKLMVNISDFPRLDGEETDDGRFERALSSFDKGALQLESTMYVIKDPITVKDYQQLNGVYGVTDIRLIDGGDISNNCVIKVATGRNMFWVSLTNLVISYFGTRTDIVGIDLKTSTHLKLENIKIKGAFYKGIIGSDVWLANLSNVTAWCDYDFGHTAFDFTSGTSINMSTVWSKNFARGFNLRSVMYSSLDSCAVDTFSVYAYTGGQGVSYNSCGAEDGKLVKGGYVWGNTYRSVGLVGCQILNIGVAEGVLKGETSVFYSMGARMSITNFRQQTDFRVSDMIDVIHALENSRVTVENSMFMNNYNEFVKMNNQFGEVSYNSGYTETVYNFDKKKEVTLSIEKEFVDGFKKISDNLVGGQSFNDTKRFLGNYVAHRNTHTLSNTGNTKSVDILSCTTYSEGTYSVNIDLDISLVTTHGTASAVRSYSLKAITRDVNGTKLVDPIVIVSGDESHGITVSWTGNILKVTLAKSYSRCFIETTVFQMRSGGEGTIEWL